MNRKKVFILIIIFFLVLPINFVFANDNELNLYSEAAILVDENSNFILYDKNSNKKMYPASTTKILTAIIAIEKCNLDDIVTVNQSAISQIPEGYSSAHLVNGEKISVKNLLSAFLVPSANDAGYVLAEYISGSISEFAKLMNEKATEIGCNSSHFVNPSGIHDDNHYTTAYDLSLIAKYCMNNKTFRDIVCQKTCTIPKTNKTDIRNYKNTNLLLNTSSKFYLPECIGIKTGYTVEAGNCLISCFSKENMNLIGVVLGAKRINNSDSTRFIDSINLFNYGYNNYYLKTIVSKNDVITNIQIKNGSKETKNLDLIAENDINVLLKKDEKIPDPVIYLNDNILGPISKDSCIGKATYNINNETYTVNLLASHDVEAINNSFILFGFLGFFIVIIISVIKFKAKRIPHR